MSQDKTDRDDEGERLVRGEVRGFYAALQDEIKKAWKAYEAQPCDPPYACATHGRCWAHFEWERLTGG